MINSAYGIAQCYPGDQERIVLCRRMWNLRDICHTQKMFLGNIYPVDLCFLPPHLKATTLFYLLNNINASQQVHAKVNKNPVNSSFLYSSCSRINM